MFNLLVTTASYLNNYLNLSSNFLFNFTIKKYKI